MTVSAIRDWFKKHEELTPWQHHCRERQRVQEATDTTIASIQYLQAHGSTAAPVPELPTRDDEKDD